MDGGKRMKEGDRKRGRERGKMSKWANGECFRIRKDAEHSPVIEGNVCAYFKILQSTDLVN